MNSKNDFIFVDVGEMFLRQKRIDELIKLVEDEFHNATDPEEITLVLGKLSALNDCRNLKHKDIIEEVIKTKKSLENHQYYDSIIDEVEYVKGYIKGLVILLNVDRKIFDIKPNFVLFIYATTEELMRKYDVALSICRELGEYNTESPIRYYVSTSEDDICEKILSLDDVTTNAVCVVYEHKNFPTKEIMQKLAFEKNDNVFLVSDTEEIKVSAIVKRIFRNTVF